MRKKQINLKKRHIETYRTILHSYIDIITEEQNLSDILDVVIHAHIKERLKNPKDPICNIKPFKNMVKMDNRNQKKSSP